MKTLYLECNMGAAGDMLTAALLELHPDPADFLRRLNTCGLPGVTITSSPAVKCGITGTHVTVTVNGEEEYSHDVHDHHHEHACEHEHTHDEHIHEHDEHVHKYEHTHDEHASEHEHGHHHHHTSMHDICHLVEDHLLVSEDVKADILAVYNLIAEAESRAHNMPIDQIHFHEVGTMDALADVTAVCMLIHELKPERICASPVHVGFGQVRCAHGILPVPAPATAYILQGVPTYGGRIEGELCTPTGAALLKHFVTDFSGQPLMTADRIGCGMGSKDFEQANCLRAVLGETDSTRDSVVELKCNLDDMTAEEIGFATDVLLDAGALDVFTTPIGMKKNRPGCMLTMLCTAEREAELVRLLFKHTTTLGIRKTVCERYILDRSETERDGIRYKTSSGCGITRTKAEYDDLAAYAKTHGLSLREAREQLK